MHDHCLCSVGGSCDICRTAHPVALATKAEVDSLLQRILDLEVHLKTENKSLRLQVLALEERNDHLENEIVMLRSSTSTKAKPSSTNNKGHYKGASPKNSLPLPARSLPAKSLPQSSIPPSTQIEIPTSNPQANEPAVTKPTSPPKAFRIVWGTQWRCTPEVLLKAISPMLPSEDSKSVVVKKSHRRSNGKSKWWFTIIIPPSTLSIIEEAWPALHAKSRWTLESSLRKHHPLPSGLPPPSNATTPTSPLLPPTSLPPPPTSQPVQPTTLSDSDNYPALSHASSSSSSSSPTSTHCPPSSPHAENNPPPHSSPTQHRWLPLPLF